MQKQHELSNPDSCMSRAKDDEPVFVLLGRDLAAPDTVRYWADRRVELDKNRPDDPQILSAHKDARAMERFRSLQVLGMGPDPAPSSPAPSSPEPEPPAWLRAALASLPPRRRGDVLRAIVRELPVDRLLCTVADAVEFAIAAAEGGEARPASEPGYGELVAVDVVLAVARALFGDVVELPRPAPVRQTVRVPGGTTLRIRGRLDADRIYLEPGAEIDYGRVPGHPGGVRDALDPRTLRTDDGYDLVFEDFCVRTRKIDAAP